MIWKAQHIETIQKKLASEFWSEKRWIAYDKMQPIRSVSDVYFFEDYQKATTFCKANGSTAQYFQIKVLGTLLKILTQGGEHRPTIIERVALTSVLEQYPLTSFDCSTSLPDCLADGDYFPVIWNQIIHPLTYIEQYHLLMKDYTNKKGENKIFSSYIISSFKFIGPAIKEFQNLAKSYGKSLCNFELMLVGQFYHQKLVVDGRGRPLQNTGILLYKAIFNTKHTKKPFYMDQIHDPVSPCILLHAVFVRYNKKNCTLNFYNSALKKMSPGPPTEYMDLTYFDFSKGMILDLDE